MSTTEQDGWVSRVLGLDPAVALRAGRADSAAILAACENWREASETVDGQIDALVRLLHGSGDEDLEDIAEFGMNALTADHKVPLAAALLDLRYGDRDALAKSGSKALAMAEAFRAHLESDERVAACDENPFGVAVSIRATLLPALTRLEAALAA